MKKYLFLILSIIWSGDVFATSYVIDTSNMHPFGGSENVVLGDDGNVVDITVNDVINGDISIYSDTMIVNLYNNGTINGTIDVNGGRLFIYNNGTQNYNIVNNVEGHYGNVVQKITPSYMGMNNINATDVDFRVQIENVENLNFSNIKNVNADTFQVTNSSIVIDNLADLKNWNKTLNVSGPITLIITDKNTINPDGEYITNIHGATDIDIQILGLGSAERIEKESLSVSNFMFKIVRETNYEIVNGEENSVVEEIRTLDPDDSLVKALDSAADDKEINAVKHKSYRFNHGILLRPIRIINNFAMMDNINNKNDFGLGLKPSYIVSDKISVLGAHVYIGNHYKNLYVNAGLNLHRFSYNDDINEFSGFLYGADVGVKQFFDKLWINGVSGINMTRFDANYVSSNNKIKNNPDGLSWYMGFDSGYDFDIGSDFIVSPIVGIAYQNYHVADVSDTVFYVRAGADAKYSFVTDGVKYEYGLNTSVVSNGNLFAAIRFGFWSIIDEAGAVLSLGMLKDDIDYNYQLSVNAKMIF